MQEFNPNDTICNRYKVLRKLGAGAMGSVYLCEDSVESQIKVALKVLISDNLDAQDVWAKGEYEALTRLRHPNLARVYNFGRIGDSKDYFIVSEFIKGIDLYSATEYLHYDELVDIIVQICRALEYIHSQGYVHFDIKPDNILVTRYKTIGIKEGSKVQYNEADISADKTSVFSKPLVKVIDFGLAEKITGSFSFAIKGTLNYLAPEILNGQTPDKRADLYSLGVTLYQVANRDLPFYQDLGGMGASQPPASRADLFGMHMKKHPEYLRTLILKLLEENPDRRFQSAMEVTQFINKHSGHHFEVETAETQASYFYSSKLVGRRREINLLKEYHERVFFPHRWHEALLNAPPARAVVDNEKGNETQEKKEAPDGEVAGDDTGVQESLLNDLPASAGSCPALLLVSGEMGSGKSRLLEEFQHFLRLNDLSLFCGNCYDGNQKAYQPIVEILRQLVYTIGLKSELFGKYRQDVLKLLPELREKPEEEDESKEAGFRPDKEKLYFIEKISQLLIESAQSIPYVLVINNLHWVDDASIDLLDNFLERVAEARKLGETLKLLVLASFRPEETIPDSLHDLIEKRKESGQCREIVLRCLKHPQIQEFLRSMLNFSDVPEEFVAKLEEKTGGNPLFVVETLKALQDDGIIKNVGGSWIIKASHYDRIEIPPRMEDLLEKRLERIEPKKHELLDVLSVLDKPANPKFLQKLKRFAEMPLLVALRDLEQSGLVAKTFEGGKLHFQIAQPKVRQILYSRIAPEQRQKYHGEVGTAFLELYRGREEEILEDLAYHFQHSDQTSKALELAIKAGDRLKGIYANERAYEYYLYVLEKVEGDPSQFSLWVETHEKLGDLCTTMGRYEMADKSYSVLLEEEVRRRLDSERVVKIFLSRGKVFEIQGDYDFSIKCYKDARNYLSNFSKDELVVERIRVFNSIGWVYVCMGKYEKAMAISLEALRVIEGAPERIEHAMVYNTIGSANFFKGNFREAIEYHRRSLQIKENLENIPEITISLNNLGNAHMAGAEYGEAAESFRRALRTSEEIGDPYGRAVTLHNFACIYFAVGQPEKGWQFLEESLKLSKLFSMRYLNIQNYMVRGNALKEQRDYAKAEGNFFRALTAFSKQGNRWGLCTVLLQIADLHRLVGNFKEARSMVFEARRYAEELDIHHLQVRCFFEEARLNREDGEEGLKAAFKLLEEALALAEKCEHPELLEEVHFEVGETLVRMRRLTEASEHYKAAEEKFREVYENLPDEFRESYRARRKSIAPNRNRSPKSPRDSKRKVEVRALQPSDGAAVEAKGSATAEDSLRRVNDLMVALNAGGPLKDFLARMLDDMVSILKADAAFLLVVQGDNLTVEVSRAAGGKLAGDPEDVICLNLIEKVLESRLPVFLADVADDPVIASVLESQNKASSALAIVPFHMGPHRQGVAYVINPQLPKGGSENNLWLLQPFLSLAPIAYHQLSSESVPAA